MPNIPRPNRPFLRAVPRHCRPKPSLRAWRLFGNAAGASISTKPLATPPRKRPGPTQALAAALGGANHGVLRGLSSGRRSRPWGRRSRPWGRRSSVSAPSLVGRAARRAAPGLGGRTARSWADRSASAPARRSSGARATPNQRLNSAREPHERAARPAPERRLSAPPSVVHYDAHAHGRRRNSVTQLRGLSTLCLRDVSTMAESSPLAEYPSKRQLLGPHQCALALDTMSPLSLERAVKTSSLKCRCWECACASCFACVALPKNYIVHSIVHVVAIIHDSMRSVFATGRWTQSSVGGAGP